MASKPDLAERIWKRLFTGAGKKALTIKIAPDPKPEILAAIRKELSR